MPAKKGAPREKKSKPEELRSAMERAGVTPDKLGVICGADEKTVHAWLSGTDEARGSVGEILAALEQLAKDPKGRPLLESMLAMDHGECENFLANEEWETKAAKGGWSGLINNIIIGAISIGGAAMLLGKIADLRGLRKK